MARELGLPSVLHETHDFWTNSLSLPWLVPDTGDARSTSNTACTFVGLALALTLLLGVAQVDFSTGDGMEIEMEPQETIDLQHVQQTRQDRTPPAPPQPAVPQVVPNNEVIEDRASGQRLLRAARAEATSAIEVTPIVSTMPVSGWPTA